MHRNEHFDVFTTVLAPQGRYQYRAEAEKMVVVHRYKPQWPDELELTPGDVILVLSKHEEGRWFGRLQDGRWGYFPASCVMELSQVSLPAKSLRRTVSLRNSTSDDAGVRRYQTGHILQALRRGSKAGGGGLVGSQTDSESSVPVQRSQIPQAQAVAFQPQTHRSPSLLHRILFKCRKKSECHGASNRAFEGD